MKAQKTQENTRTLLFAGLAITMLFVGTGCTEERPFKEKPADQSALAKPEQKSLVDTSAEYLYVPSSLNSTRTTDATFPMYMGEGKVVKLQFGEDSLNIVAIENEDRFAGNPVNEKPVLSIPIRHVDYRCAPDADGKCTNVEEEDEGKPWAQRTFFQIKKDKMAVQEINFLPIEITNLIAPKPCYTEIGSEVTGIKIEPDAINLSVEKVFHSSLSCASSLHDLSDLTFRVVYHYSLVKLNTISSPAYKSLVYTSSDETTFGYFDTKTMKLDVDNSSNQDGEVNYVKRWNPTKTVTYYLTENFNKPENAKIKASTIAGVANINKTLKAAGAKLQIEVRDAPAGFNPGDIRASSIVMIEDPVNFGILGYGPSAENPKTGEIVHARAAMYLGVIKTSIRRAYEDVVEEKISLVEKAKSESKTESKKDGSGELNTKETAGVMSLAPALKTFSGKRPTVDVKQFAKIKAAIAKGEPVETPAHHTHTHTHTLAETLSSSDAQDGSSFTGGLKPIADREKLSEYSARRDSYKISFRHIAHLVREQELKPDDLEVARKLELAQEQLKSLHCFYDVDNFNVNDTLEGEIEKLVEELGAKPWLALTEAEKTKVIDTLLPFVWVPTLIHEIGHTLGLRHNFAGSEDKANFYTEAELDEMGVKRQFAYSSVMDYGYRATNELQIMGKYDLAALRFGYAEKVELADGKLISIQQFRSTPNQTLKDYDYCTDEHVSVNPNCNRFDEGTNLVEIAEHWVNMYEQEYLRRNFRNGARDFSLLSDTNHIRRLNRVFFSLRMMHERYDDIKNTFGLDDAAPEWQQIEFLKQLKESTKIAGNFFMRVLETPDTMCAVAPASMPNLIIAVVPLRMLSPFAINCFDPENVRLVPAYKMVGQAGKSFQSRKDPHSTNRYLDQIDVRGIWLDKMLALNGLVARKTGIESFDRAIGNFLDMKDMRGAVQTSLATLLLDEVVTDVAIHTISGQTLVARLPVKLFSTAASENSHFIPEPLDSRAQRAFRIPSLGIDFQAQAVRVLSAALPGSHEQETNAGSLLNIMKARLANPWDSTPPNTLEAKIGSKKILVDVEAQLSALQLVNREIVTVFATLGEEKLTEILEDIEAEKPVADEASDAEKLARALGKDVIEKYLQGGFQDKVYYEKILVEMI